jgi:hypothetical protein
MSEELTRRLAVLVAAVRAGDDEQTRRLATDTLPAFVKWVLDDEEKARGAPFDRAERSRLERVLSGVCAALARTSAAVGAGRQVPGDLLPAW